MASEIEIERVLVQRHLATADVLQMKQIVEKMTADDVSRLIPHLHSYFVTIGNVLNDLNFKVTQG